MNGDYKSTIGILITWGVGQLVRQLIQPKIVGDSVGVPEIPTLFMMFIGFKFSGVLGMIIAVPLGLILITLYEEGSFDTTKNSVKILLSGINRFRRLKPEDLKVVQEDFVTSHDVAKRDGDFLPTKRDGDFLPTKSDRD